MQKVMIIGRIGRDPEVKTANSGSTICSFSVACSEKRGGEEKTEWFRVKCFGKTAEFVANYLTKGRLVYVEGKLETQKYTKDGVERSSTELLADKVDALDKAENAQQNHQQAANRGRTAPSEMEDMPW